MASGQIQKRSYGTTTDGIPVDQYTLTNADQLELTVITYGGIITSLRVPNRSGRRDDIVLGFDKLSDYETNSPYFGAIIGRYGNRIARGKFTLNGKEYTLALNDGPNTLHGGTKGFDKQVWTAKEAQGGAGVGLELSYLSKDGEEGYPGNLSVKVVYTLTDTNELHINYSATTDKSTVVNLTHHSYYNLAGDGAGSVENHIVTINADRFTPIDDTLIPTGELAPVKGTPFDFQAGKRIGADLRQVHQQLVYGRGFDHDFILKRPQDNSLALAAHVSDPASGRTMEVLTTEPSIQFYTGNFLNGTLVGTGGVYRQADAFCLETQHLPDSPNKPNFPSTVLEPGDTYQSSTVFKFAVST